MTTKPSSSRRKFLATLGVGGAAAATVVLNRQAVAPGLKSEPVPPQGKGYQVTEHVRNYYRTAKV